MFVSCPDKVEAVQQLVEVSHLVINDIPAPARILLQSVDVYVMTFFFTTLSNH
jgi:hypothetical protein